MFVKALFKKNTVYVLLQKPLCAHEQKAESKWSPQGSGIWALTLSYLSVWSTFSTMDIYNLGD